MRSEERGVGGGAGGGVPRVRIAVLGSPRVGKSALVVRYLTRRFIGEYHSNSDLVYRQSLCVRGTRVALEVTDTSGCGALSLQRTEGVDTCVVVYSVIDRASFEDAAASLSALRRATHAHNMPLALIANKTDLDHLRQVSREEGESVSACAGARFCETSVAEAAGGAELYSCMDALVTEARRRASPPVRLRKFSVSKMLGGLMGSAPPAPPALPAVTRSGSVVVPPPAPPSAAAPGTP